MNLKGETMFGQTKVNKDFFLSSKTFEPAYLRLYRSGELQKRAKYLRVGDLASGGYVLQNGEAEEISIFTVGDAGVTVVEDYFRSLSNPFLDQTADAILALR